MSRIRHAAASQTINMYGNGCAIVAWGTLTQSVGSGGRIAVSVVVLSMCMMAVSARSGAGEGAGGGGGGGSDVLMLRHERSRERHSTERSKIRWGLQAFDNLTLSYDAYNDSSEAEETSTSATSPSSSSFAALVGDVNQFAIAPNEMFHLDATEEQAESSSSRSNMHSDVHIDNPLFIGTVASSTNHGSGNGDTTNDRDGSIGIVAVNSSRPRGGKKKVKKRKIMADIQADVDKGLAYIRKQTELGADVSSVPDEVLKSFTADPVAWGTNPTTTATTTSTTTTTTTTTQAPDSARTAAASVAARVANATIAPSSTTQRQQQQGNLEETPNPSEFRQDLLPPFRPVVTTADNGAYTDENASFYTELGPYAGNDDDIDTGGGIDGIDMLGINSANDSIVSDGMTVRRRLSGTAGGMPVLSDYDDAELELLDETSRNNRINLMSGRDLVTKFLHIVEAQHSLGSNCTAGTDLNLGEGIVDRYAQDRFRVQAEIAVNRANMLTRIFKQAAPEVHLSEHLLHASVLSMVEFNEDIFAGGHCFDYNQHPLKGGLYCPFAYRLPEPDIGVTLAKDLAAEYHYLGNTSEWFYQARKNAEKVIDKNEQFIRSYHMYTNSSEREFEEILSVRYEDGRWSKPYYDCGGGNIWMLTYTVPFFGYDNGTYIFKGTSGIDIDLRRVDIDQCPQRIVPGVTQPLNLFAGTDKCKHRTTECSAISALGFRRGSYKCTCRRGFYFPDTSIPQKYFNGTTLEEEYEKLMMNEMSDYNKPNEFECLPCSEGCDTCIDASPCVAALNWPMRTCILVLAIAVIGLLAPAVYFTYRYEQVKVLRAASPVLLRVIALGALFIYGTTIVIYPKPSVYTCTARTWLREIGFSLTYGALMLKTWRISVIFRVRSAKAVKITDASLIKRLAILCGCVSVALLVRTIVAPPGVVVRRTADDLKAFLCHTDWWDHFFTTMEVGFLAWGVRLCIMVRKAPSEFNESKYISIAIYNEFLITCFLNVSMLFLQSPANPDLLYIIFFCHTQLTVTILLALIFGSRVYMVFRSSGKPAEDTVFMGAKVSGAKFINRSQPKTFTNNPSSSSTAQIDPDTDSRFTDDDAVQQIRLLCAQLLNLQDRASVREVASATIATLLENCGSSHTSTLRPPPNSPPAHSQALTNGGTSGAGSSGVDAKSTKATNTSCDEMLPLTTTYACCCQVPPVTAEAAMCAGDTTLDMGSDGREKYRSCTAIRCMCSENSIDEPVALPADASTLSNNDAIDAQATLLADESDSLDVVHVVAENVPTFKSKVRASDVQPRPIISTTTTSTAPSNCSVTVASSDAQGHSNILVYAQLGNNVVASRPTLCSIGPSVTTTTMPTTTAPRHMMSLEVDEELNRNSIVLDDNDYLANDCSLEHEANDATSLGGAAETMTATATTTAASPTTMTTTTMTTTTMTAATAAVPGSKLVLDLSDRSKYTKEVSV